MADINVPSQAARTCNSIKGLPNRGGAVASPTQCFSSAEVASLIRHHEEVSELVGALIEAIANMLPEDADGEPEHPGVTRLLAHCEELLGDQSFSRYYKDRIEGLQGAGA